MIACANASLVILVCNGVAELRRQLFFPPERTPCNGEHYAQGGQDPKSKQVALRRQGNLAGIDSCVLWTLALSTQALWTDVLSDRAQDHGGLLFLRSKIADAELQPRISIDRPFQMKTVLSDFARGRQRQHEGIAWPGQMVTLTGLDLLHSRQAIHEDNSVSALG